MNVLVDSLRYDDYIADDITLTIAWLVSIFEIEHNYSFSMKLVVYFCLFWDLVMTTNKCCNELGVSTTLQRPWSILAILYSHD